MEEVNDQIEQLKRGEENALRVFAEEFYPLVMSLVSRKIPEKARQEDLTQDVFLKIFSKRVLQKFKGKTSQELKAYVMRVTINYLSDYFDSRRNKEDLVDSFDFADPENSDAISYNIDFLEQIEEEELMEKLDKAIERLPLNFKEIIRYRLMGFSNKEIGEMMGIPRGTINTWAARALEKLSRLLKE